MKNEHRFGPLLGIAFMTAAGVAFAADAEPTASGNATNSPPAVLSTAPMDTDTVETMDTDTVETDDTGTRHLLPPEAVIGKDVTNTMGETIGKVTEIAGERIVVAVGGFLGIGAHDVALNWNEITASGDGDDIELQTTMSKDQLEKMPEHEG